MFARFPLTAVCGIAAVLGVAAGRHDAVGRAFAAAAGSAYEAAPFVLFATLLGDSTASVGRARSIFAFVDLGGCGCARSRVPGALTIPALAVTLLSFGPFVAAARVAAALAGRAARTRVARAATRPPAFVAPGDTAATGNPAVSENPSATLTSIAAAAFLASLAATALGSGAVRLSPPVLFSAGLVLGAIAPCATAGVAIAAGFAHALPASAAGVLCTAGIVTLPREPAPVARGGGTSAGPVCADGRFVDILLGVALALLAVVGPSGLVNPRLLPAIAGAAALSFGLAFRPTKKRNAAPSASRRTAAPASRSLAAPALMLAALIHPEPVSTPAADGTRLDAAFPGEYLAFTGVAHRTSAGTTLSRLSITCCRLDASPIAVRLDRTLGARDGAWIEADGVLLGAAEGSLVLHPARIAAVTAPSDPFVYR